MKIGFVVVAVAVLAGCGPSSVITNYPMPPELSDCSQYRLRAGDLGTTIVVVRCPNSTTSTTHPVGKSRSTTVVIDGVEYTPKR